MNSISYFANFLHEVVATLPKKMILPSMYSSKTVPLKSAGTASSFSFARLLFEPSIPKGYQFNFSILLLFVALPPCQSPSVNPV